MNATHTAPQTCPNGHAPTFDTGFTGGPVFAVSAVDPGLRFCPHCQEWFRPQPARRPDGVIIGDLDITAAGEGIRQDLRQAEALIGTVDRLRALRVALGKTRRQIEREAERAQIIARSTWVRAVTWTTTGPATGTVRLQLVDREYRYDDVDVARYASLWRSARRDRRRHPKAGIADAIRRVWFGKRTGKPAGNTGKVDLRPELDQDIPALLVASLAGGAA
jgi:hypothetical protein